MPNLALTHTKRITVCVRNIRKMVRRPSDFNRFDTKYTARTGLGVFQWRVGGGDIFFLPKNVPMDGKHYEKVVHCKCTVPKIRNKYSKK